MHPGALHACTIPTGVPCTYLLWTTLHPGWDGASLKISPGLGQIQAMLVWEVGQKQRSGRNPERPVVYKPKLNGKACYANTARLLLTLSQQQTKWFWGFLSSWQHAGSEGSSGHCMEMHFLPSLAGKGQAPLLGHVASSRRREAPKDDATEQFVFCEGFLSLCQHHFHH